MTRILSTALAATLLFSASSFAQQASPTAVKVAGAIQTLSCYDTLGSIEDPGTNSGFQSSGECQKTCTIKNSTVMVTSGGTTCYCGDTLPANNHKADETDCNIPCGGYDVQNCGGVGFYQFYLTGLGAPKVDSDSSSSSSASSSATSATSAANTVVVTEAPEPSSSSSGGGSSKVGIAVGVVVGVVAIAGLIGAGVFIYKRRQRKQIEEEHARTAAVSSFVKSETSSANDSRLDPSISSHRRQSIGSIADERDFTRRILQVRTTHHVLI
jgi:cell wall integrity and stress response component